MFGLLYIVFEAFTHLGGAVKEKREDYLAKELTTNNILGFDYYLDRTGVMRSLETDEIYSIRRNCNGDYILYDKYGIMCKNLSYVDRMNRIANEKMEEYHTVSSISIGDYKHSIPIFVDLTNDRRVVIARSCCSFYYYDIDADEFVRKTDNQRYNEDNGISKIGPSVEWLNERKMGKVFEYGDRKYE